ncbi:2672_t:CDS:2 [Cetraspora pellucida]|uniref:2672_t:CDS:1 n=1 Tax=Cetraspora pellucida TaxID=1433469 RepID=A0A9N9J0Q2_9GLOM|nr:2672_t:CDS:2 [Cetraspora pellucida]
MELCCDWGGMYNNPNLTEATRSRQRSTRLIDCPFELYTARHDGLWHLEQLESVAVITTAGSHSREIISTLQQNNESTLVINRPRPRVIVTDRKLALMNALETFFSDSVNLLYVWHISKNILKNCRSQFPKDTNNEDNEWNDFLRRWNDIITDVISYLEETWMPWKKWFVKTWTNEILHLGITVTSRIEGSHAVLKAYLQTSARDLHWVCMTITLAVTNQKKEIDSIIESEHIHIPIFACNNSLYANLRGKVSAFAFKKINKQYQRITLQKQLPPCTRSFSRTISLPCAHYIQNLDANQSIPLENIYKHWWIQECPPIPQIRKNILHHEDLLEPLLQNLEERYQEWSEHQRVAARETLNNMIDSPIMALRDPQVVRTKGHPSDASNHRPTNTTKRDPFGFEFVDHKTRQCSLCKQPRHNAHTCLNRSSTN